MTEGNFLSTLVYQSDDLSFTLETTDAVRATLLVKKKQSTDTFKMSTRFVDDNTTVEKLLIQPYSSV